MRALLLLLVLVGCTSIPPRPQFPTAPTALIEQCPNLDLINNDVTQMSDILVIISNNYSKYHECQIKQESWVEWYHNQKKIYERD